ncbi:MAG: hypothetical protein HY238_02110 [Acidobacteria bacterium]|nr:hypothetical protein [Acidobacteriota bacterium]
MSLEERYPDRQTYLDQVAAAARALANERYMLPQDVAPLVESSARQRDALTASKIAAR